METNLKYLKSITKKYLKLEEIYNILIFNKIKYIEIGGYIDLKNNFFYIKKELSKIINNRPCIFLNIIKNQEIYWHLHPYQNNINNNYPSLEDLENSINHKNKINVLLTKKNIYIFFYYPKDYVNYKKSNINNLKRWYNYLNKNYFVKDVKYRNNKINELAFNTGINLIHFKYYEYKNFWHILEKIYNRKWYISK